MKCPECGEVRLKHCAMLDCPLRQQAFNWDARKHARGSDPATSHAAARSVNGKALMARILMNIEVQGPATFSEIATRMGLAQVQVWKRLSDLKNEGLIEESGITRIGPSRRQQTVWMIVKK